MMRRFIGVAVAALATALLLAGCGSGMKTESAAKRDAVASADVSMNFSEAYDGNGESGNAAEQAADIYGGSIGGTEKPSKTEEVSAPSKATIAAEAKAEADSLAGAGNTIENMSNAILSERKIIRSASLTIEVENFDEACNEISSIILGIGIVQESNISTEKYYADGKLKLIKRGTIVLRVNKDKFDSVINSLKGIGTVYNQQINGQDVTDRYVDTESRLRLLKLEQSRLESYLMKLEDLDKIFATERRLTEIRQEIESLTGNLNKMNSLVELSTITLTMNEKYPDSDEPPKPVTYWDKLLRNLKSSFEGTVAFLGDLLIFIVAALPVLILLGLFVLLGVFIYRRIPRKRKGFNQGNSVNASGSTSENSRDRQE